MKAARYISFWTGFCSLSLEIIWVRLYGYAGQSTPQAFAYVLALYLLGIALGAHFGKRLCTRPARAQIEHAAVLALLLAAVVAIAAPWAFIKSRSLHLDSLAAPLCIACTAAALAVLFPITHHLGTPSATGACSTDKGRHFSRVYIANVAGAALGPLFTGYVLLEYLTLDQAFVLLASLVAATGLGTALAYRIWRQPSKCSAILLCSLLCAVLILPAGYSALQQPHVFAITLAQNSGKQVVEVHENRHGIITISEMRPNRRQDFTDYAVYGGNVYDGKVNVDLERNTNGLERPLLLHALQPQAKKVLLLGLSIGSWLTVVEGFPGIEHIDVVEINAGYASLAQRYPAQRAALQDPRLHLFIDDARRWLQYHPTVQYDFILMNTTWHWRANSSMLLSKEMMEIGKKHLRPGGVLAFNATGSVDAFYTASKVFTEVRRYQNFIYAAQSDVFSKLDEPAAWEHLQGVTINGAPAFRDAPRYIQKYAAIPRVRIEEDLKKLGRAPEIITDDNMLVEYRYGRR